MALDRTKTKTSFLNLKNKFQVSMVFFYQRKITTLFIFLFFISLCTCNKSDPSIKEKPTLIEQIKSKLTFPTDTSQTDSIGLKFGLGNYNDLFAQLNGINKKHYDSLLIKTGGNITWDSIVYKSDSSHINSRYKIFGWHPFWMGSAFKSYNYDLLSYISWFSYDVDPISGSYSNPDVIQELRDSGKELIQLAQEKDSKVLLTITNHGREKTEQFLSNTSAQQMVLIDSVLELIQTLEMDGLDLNFENIHPRYGREMTAFVKKLSNRLKALNPDYIFSLTIPKVNKRQYNDIASLNEYVDLFVLIGYDFHTRGSKKDGPIAPLFATNGQLSIQTVVESYITNGLEPTKILLGLPYYGTAWTSGIPDMKNNNRQFKEQLTYRSIMARYGKTAPPEYDELSKSAYYQKKIGPNNYEKVWFDDSITLKMKYEWVKENNLGGIAIWALGYDNGRTELWRTIDSSFAENEKIAVPIKGNVGFRLASWMSTFKVPIFITILFWTAFLALGFFISLFDWRVRNFLFSNKSSRLIFILAIFGLTTFTFITYFFSDQFDSFGYNNGVVFLGGIIAGGIITGIIMYLYHNHRSNLP